ncbi:NIPSNAP family protein [Granulicella sp. dw_53]|uniref:NIPSNAP family protein n=1 Tax=Granulicella sp. dw_53 TaxID=2719792 RepID=UPI001BD30985|nr:NIPSNAP family protein [Granulicella sp. dw_53]
MDRRQMITGAAAMSALLTSKVQASVPTRSFLEIKTWYLHNSHEAQAKRISDYLETGLFPALTRAGAKPIAAFSNLIGADGPYLVTITQYPSLVALQDTLTKLAADETHEKASQQLSSGAGMPFVTVESSLLHSLAILPEPAIPTDAASRPPRIFELRTYQSQSMSALNKKVGMFNNGEIATFQRLGMRPIFIGESIIGPRQPNITYMLSFDNLDGREKLWQQFGSDPEWKRLSAPPELKDAEIVANISNTILRPLPFSPVK